MKRKMSDMVQDAYMDELLDLEPVQVDEEAVMQRTLAKLGMERAGTQRKAAAGKATPFVRKVAGGKPGRRALRVTAVAVALMLGLSTAVYAAAVIYNMIQQKVDYFEPGSTMETPVSEPNYHGALAMDIEQYNASVGMSVTDNGKTVTLDAIAVDDNFINAFFTIAYDEPLDLDNIPYVEAYMPAYYKLSRLTPWFTMQVNGQDIDGGYSTQDEYDPYMTDDSTVKMMVRWVVPTILPDTFELSLHAEEYDMATGDSSKATGTFHFDLTVDKSASARATRAAAPGQYTLGGRILDLHKLAVTPFGGVLTVDGHWDSDEDSPDPGYLMAGNLYITDDKGNVLNSFWNNTMTVGAPIYGIELIGGASDAESITITPILPKDNWDDEESRNYSVADIGAKIEIDSLSGYYLEDYIVEGRRVSLVLRPYGPCNYTAGGIMLDDDNITLAGGRSGLVNQQVDRKTGLFTYSVDYYAATPEELAAITTFHVYYDGVFELDEAAAVTLPLSGATN